MKTRDVFAVFNRGRISRLALARTDVSRVALSAEVQKNWMPRVLGPMSLRPGLQYHGAADGNGAYIPFIYDTDDTAILELTAGKMRVWENGDTLVTRETVSATISNGGFYDDLSGWTTDDEGSAVSDWLAVGVGGAGNGVLRLTGTGYDYAKTRQGVSVSPAEASQTHSLSIRVPRGPVILRIGSSVGADDVFRQAVLRTGNHSISFVPGGDFWIEFRSSLQYPVWVGDVAVEAGGVMEVGSPWDTVARCQAVRTTQSGDVIYCACDGLPPYQIERRDNNSWSVVRYEPTSGPFLTENTSTVRLTPSAQTGFITLTSSEPIFQSGHVGALFRLTSQGQNIDFDATGEGQWSDPIRISGVGVDRNATITIAGTWSGTVTYQRSIGAPGAWTDHILYTSNISGLFNDGLDNSVVYYRIGIDTGDYTSGTAECLLEYPNGSITGIVKVSSYSSSTSVSAIVVDYLGGTDATEIWSEGAWSEVSGWPQAVTIGSDGRMWWSGNGRNWASVPDAFLAFDPDIEGDSAPINRGVGVGAPYRTNWMLPLSHIIVGTGAAEYSIRSTSFDEPITPSNYNAKAPSTKGSANVPAVSIDDRGYFVGRNKKSLYELKYDPQTYRYQAQDVTLLCPEIGDGEFVRLAVQIEPDVRVHCIRADGTAAILVVDAVENVLCWFDLETDGLFQDVTVLPGVTEDRVFYRVSRTINGVNVFHHEEMARFDQCVGGTINRQADSFVIGNGPVSGLSHLEGKSVVIWGDGEDRGVGTVASGTVAGLSFANWCAGLPYTATYKSAKLSGQTSLGLSLSQYKRINSIGLILDRTHHDGLEFGPDFESMDRLPSVEDGAIVADGTIYDHFDQEPIGFPGLWDPNSRICLRAAAPRPCTVLAAILNVDRQDSD